MTRRPRRKTPVTPAERLSEGLRAKAEYEQLSASFDETRDRLLEAFAATKMGEGDVRERLYLAVNVLDQVKSALLARAANAPLAEQEAAIQGVMNGR